MGSWFNLLLLLLLLVACGHLSLLKLLLKRP